MYLSYSKQFKSYVNCLWQVGRQLCALFTSLSGQKEIQQRTEFVTSEFRAKVKEALEFRNRFAERPFLCRGLLQKGNIVVSLSSEYSFYKQFYK